MTSPSSDNESMFIQKLNTKSKSPTRTEISKIDNTAIPAEIITVKDFFDFMKTAYQVYEHLEGDESESSKINWEELTKLTVINHVIDQEERDLLYQTSFSIQKPLTSKSDTAIEKKNNEIDRVAKHLSCSEIEGKCRRRRSLPPEARVEMLGVWTEANLNCKLNDVINEGILDSILPYLVGYKKASKTTSVYNPIIKKSPSNQNAEVKKLASFGGFVNEKESRDRLGRRKSSIIAAQERINNQKHEGDVEIHVCDEVKGLKKDFKCPQKLLVTKMGYFADVTAGQRLEDMDISVHCDIQIFDWLMRWVKRDTILVADWPLLDPHNVVPILVSASFLQMEPLLHDCLIYCHAHMNDIVKTTTNLACLSDAMLTRLAAMYTNAELEAIRDRKDKVQSRLYCKMILSLAEPVPETLRGHYASLATLFKCSKCNKLLGRHIAEQVPCQPANMKIDRRGNVISTHVRDSSWSLNEYISWLYGDLRQWRRVYWRLWADCHFLKCQICDTYFPAYQMEWCCWHSAPAAPLGPVPGGAYACCGQRVYIYEPIPRHTGCQFREHAVGGTSAAESAMLALCGQFRDMIAMRPPHLHYPERLTRLVPRESSAEKTGRLQCHEQFWWEGIQLVPPRPTLGLLGKLYSGDTNFNPLARPESPSGAVAQRGSDHSLAGNCSGASGTVAEGHKPRSPSRVSDRTTHTQQKGVIGCGDTESGATGSGGESESESDGESAGSDECSPRPRPRRQPAPQRQHHARRTRVVGRQWAPTLSARSNQDGQRRFEERAVRQMKAVLAKTCRGSMPPTPPQPPRYPGGVYARLEAEWRERHSQRPRNTASAKPRQPTRGK